MPEPTPQKTHSSLLKNTREAKGLTLDIVHEATKIPLDALKAIEEGYSVRILTPFYYRGFLKIYAEFLGLDPAEVMAHYEVQKPKPVPIKPSRFEQSKPGFTLSTKNRVLMLRIAGIALAIFVVLRIGGCAVKAFKKHASAKPVIAAAPVVPNVIKTQSNSAKVSLAVRVPKDTWIMVKADNKVVFQARMKKGTAENWSAKDQIELSGKNINELDLEVNGRHIGALGGAERGAKRVVITKEGLTVKK